MNENIIPCRYVKYVLRWGLQSNQPTEHIYKNQSNRDSALVLKNLKFPHKCVSSSLKLCLTNFENKRSVIFGG